MVSNSPAPASTPKMPPKSPAASHARPSVEAPADPADLAAELQAIYALHWRDRTDAQDGRARELDRLITHTRTVVELLASSGLSPRHIREARRLAPTSGGQWGAALETIWAGVDVDLPAPPTSSGPTQARRSTHPDPTARRTEQARFNAEWLARYEHARPPRADGTGPMILLTGPRGTGKTTLAHAIALGAIDRGRPAVYATVGEMLRAIRDTYRRDSSQTERQVFEQHARAALLILDECHERAGTEHEARTLTAILDERYRHERPTLLITNHTPEAAAEALGPSIADRLAEVGQVVELTGPSWRGGGR